MKFINNILRGKNNIFFRKKIIPSAAVLAVLGLFFLAIRFLTGPLLQTYSYSKLIYSADQVLLRMTLSGDQKYRFKVSLDDIPQDYVTELLKKEDKYFYSHFGFNPVSLMKAMQETYLTKSRRRGASTITMQLARLLSIDGSNTFVGKIKQLAFAIYLESRYSKKEILEAYLTLTPYGRNIESLPAASFLYFGKTPKQLTPLERSLLLNLPQNPNAKNRRLAFQKLPFRAPHFTDRILELSSALMSANQTIKTTLNYKLQSKVEAVNFAYLQSKRRYGINNSALLVARISTGEIVSYVGSGDYFNREISGQVNGVSSRRSPGSLLKPFLYALAIEQGLIHPQTLLKDLPTSFGLYDPENFDRTFRGPIPATTSLVESRNIPAVQLLKDSQGFTKMLRHFGVERMNTEEFYGLGAALGGVEVTMEEVTSMYQQLSHYNKVPRLVFSTEPRSEFIYNNFSPYLSPESRFLTAQMLIENKLNQQLDAFKKRQKPVAWKTGTSYGYRDAWTSGIYDDFVISVWLGNFTGEFNPYLKGREIAAPLFFEVIEQIKGSGLDQGTVTADWSKPSRLKVSQVEVCSLSGGMATEHCPHHKKTWFIPGKSPIHDCRVHQKILINTVTKKRVCPGRESDDPNHTVSQVFEVWPSDLYQLFKRAGLFYKLPPPFEGTCDQQPVLSGDLQIVLPRKDIIQTISIKNPLQIYLKATAASSVKKLDWFIDNEYVGSNHPEELLSWTPKNGQFQVKVVDDRGDVASQDLVVETVR